MRSNPRVREARRDEFKCERADAQIVHEHVHRAAAALSDATKRGRQGRGGREFIRSGQHEVRVCVVVVAIVEQNFDRVHGNLGSRPLVGSQSRGLAGVQEMRVQARKDFQQSLVHFEIAQQVLNLRLEFDAHTRQDLQGAQQVLEATTTKKPVTIARRSQVEEVEERTLLVRLQFVPPNEKARSLSFPKVIRRSWSSRLMMNSSFILFFSTEPTIVCRYLKKKKFHASGQATKEAEARRRAPEPGKNNGPLQQGVEVLGRAVEVDHKFERHGLQFVVLVQVEVQDRVCQESVSKRRTAKSEDAGGGTHISLLMGRRAFC